jgi:hypothetical protein
MKTENRRQTVQATPACWQREAPCPCLRIETSPNESHVFPYQHLVTASLTSAEQSETLRLLFSSHDVELQGRNLRTLLLALQDFAVKWIRAMPERYHALADGDSSVVSTIHIRDANST